MTKVGQMVATGAGSILETFPTRKVKLFLSMIVVITTLAACTESRKSEMSREIIESFSLMETVGTGRFTGVALSPDGKTLAIAGDRGIWLTSVDEFSVEEMDLIPGPVAEGIEFSPDGIHVAVRGAESVIQIWNVRTKELATEIVDPLETRVLSLAWTRDGERLLSSAYADRSLKAWNPRTGDLEQQVDDVGGFVRRMKVSPNGEMVLWPPNLVLDYNDTTRSLEWSSMLDDGIGKYYSIAMEAIEIEWSHDDSRVLLVEPKRLTIYNQQSGEVELSTEAMVDESIARSDLTVASWSPDGRWISFYNQGAEKALEIWNATTLTRNEEFDYHTGLTGSESTPIWTPDSKKLIFFGPDGVIELLNVEKWTVTEKIESQLISEAAWSQDGSELVYRNRDTYYVRDQAGEREIPFPYEESSYEDQYTMILSPSFERAMVCFDEYKNEALIYDLDDPENVTRLEFDVTNQSYRNSCSRGDVWSPDGEKIVTFNWGGDFDFWDSSSGKRISRFDYFAAMATVAGPEYAMAPFAGMGMSGFFHNAWSPDSKYYAIQVVYPESGDYDNPYHSYVWVMNSENGELEESIEVTNVFDGVGSNMVEMDWTSSGIELVLSTDEEAAVISLPGGKVLARIPDAIDEFTWSPDRDYIATAGTEDGTVFTEPSIKIWDVNSEELVTTLNPDPRWSDFWNGIEAIDWSPDGRLLSVSNYTVRIWGPTK